MVNKLTLISAKVLYFLYNYYEITKTQCKIIVKEGRCINHQFLCFALYWPFLCKMEPVRAGDTQMWFFFLHLNQPAAQQHHTVQGAGFQSTYIIFFFLLLLQRSTVYKLLSALIREEINAEACFVLWAFKGPIKCCVRCYLRSVSVSKWCCHTQTALKAFITACNSWHISE